MGSQWYGDKAHRRAMKAGYRSRASYKLIDLQNRYSVIRQDDNVVDLGAAPGGWLQVARDLTKGKIVGIDLNPIAPLEGVTTITGDFTAEDVQKKVMDVVNVVLSDASPRLSGQKCYDQARIADLTEAALAFACKMLKPGGNCVVKSFEGELFGDLMNEARKHFRSVRAYRAGVSRKGSTEIYIIAKNFIGDYNDT